MVINFPPLKKVPDGEAHYVARLRSVTGPISRLAMNDLRHSHAHYEDPALFVGNAFAAELPPSLQDSPAARRRGPPDISDIPEIEESAQSARMLGFEPGAAAGVDWLLGG